MSRSSVHTHAGALVLAVSLILQASSGAAATPLWSSTVTFTNVVASTPFQGGGYPIPDGSTAPVPGTCGPQPLNSNHSESWIAVKPGTEDLIGSSKFFISKWSTFYNFHLGSYTILGGTPVANNQVQGYECTTVGTQEMPPSWTNNTDPNVDFDTTGRAYQVTLPFNAYWTNLHPDGAIMISYTDDMGAHWITGNGGEPLEQSPNASSFQYGHVEDKQWVAVNHIVGHRYQDHVYAFWAVFNGAPSGGSVDLRVAMSADRGATFSRYSSFPMPSVSGHQNYYVQPSIDAAGDLYVAFGSTEKDKKGPTTLWVAKSTDDAQTFSFYRAATGVGIIDSCCLPNTTFRDGIAESFAASPTYPGHLYMTYEDWDFANRQMDVKFVESSDGGVSWTAPVKVNDNIEPGYTDQFQPSIAAGPNGAVAIAFYDRRAACPNNASVLAADVGRTNFCIDVTLQAYKDSGSGAQPVLANTRITKYTWDPMNPGQHVDGIGQMACAAHRDPCTRNAFIGDYFGLAISGGNIYALFVSTHYASNVTADEGGPVYYQQQILAKVPRSAYGTGY